MAQVGAPQALQSFLGAVPKEGPMVIPWNIDFTAQSSYTFDLTALQLQTRISMIQTLYVDNSQQSVPFYIFIAVTNQRIVIPAYSQGYVSLPVTNKLALTMTSASGAIVPIDALNIAMNTYIWSAAGSANVVNGLLQVQDTILESGVVSGYYQTRNFLTASGGAIVAQYAGTSTAQGTINDAAAHTIFTASATDGWVLTGIELALSANATLAAAGVYNVAVKENTTTILTSGSAFVPTTAVTGLTGPVKLEDKVDLFITSKIAASSLSLTANVALATGSLQYNLQYALNTNFVGG